jgi:hypothetical protein
MKTAAVLSPNEIEGFTLASFNIATAYTKLFSI